MTLPFDQAAALAEAAAFDTIMDRQEADPAIVTHDGRRRSTVNVAA